MVKILLNKGVEIDEFWWGRTPLMIAAQKGHEQIVRMLAEAGASINLENTSGWTAESLARDNNQIKIVEYLKEKTQN